MKGHGDVKMKVGEDGHIEGFEQPGARLNGLGAVFDVNDAIIRALGGNPYRHEEHRLAEATREQRICQMVEAARRDTREAIFNLKERLASVWGLDDLSLHKRKELLFELWEECLDDGDAASPGAIARATIEEFIREALPPSSPAAFTPVELAMLNERRTSARPFAPYTNVRGDAGVDQP